MTIKVWTAKALARHATIEPIALTGRQHKKPPKSVTAKIAREGELPDNLYGGEWPVVSARLKVELAKLTFAYPVGLIGLDGKKRKEQYFLLNPKSQVNCIEWKKCDMTWSGSRHDSPIVAFDKLVLHGMNTDSSMLLFGASNLYGVLFVRDVLFKTLKSKGYTGLARSPAGRMMRKVSGEDPEEQKQKLHLVKLAREFGRACASAVDIDDADLDEQADNWWFQDGVMAFEAKDVELPEVWAGEVAAAYREAWMVAARKD